MIVGPVEFASPAWLLLAPALWVVTLIVARRSLTGFGSRMMLTAIVIRCVVGGLIAGALAEPHVRRESQDVSVILVADQSRSMPPGLNQAMTEYLSRAVESAEAKDRLGVVTAAEQPLAQILPSDRRRPTDVVSDTRPGEWFPGSVDGTDLGAAVRLAMALKPEETAARIVLFSDGNETSGSLLEAAESARAAGIVIDVLPIPYALEREVLFERIVSPPTARLGQTVNLRFVLSATKATEGVVSLMQNRRVVDLSPEAPGDGRRVKLEPGSNVFTASVTLEHGGPQRFEALFEADREADDAVGANNRSEAVTFVSSEGKLLIVSSDAEFAEPLRRALSSARIDAEVVSPEAAPISIVDLQGYDGVLLMDVPAHALTGRQQKELASYVHDSGGGLGMIGGPNSFGAGGWLGTPVAEALPVRLDPPQKRQIMRGALVLVMHSCEIPEGNYWGQQTALAAVKALSRLDLVGIVEYGWGANVISPDGAHWAFPLNTVGDGLAVSAAINNLQFGDAPDFGSLMAQAHSALSNANAGQKHCIIISDGDPTPPSNALMSRFIKDRITVSCVLAFPHPGDFGSMQRMESIAKSTGGQYYAITSQGQLGTLPQIFTKEAQVVKRSLIWEGDPVRPTISDGSAEAMRGVIGPLPEITGYVVTAEKPGLAVTTIKGPEGDPIVAQMQHGLGRTLAFTSDATSRWSNAWVSWEGFRSFWDQHMRWLMRPAGSSELQVDTQTVGDRTRVLITATRKNGEALSFARFRARVVKPDLSASDFEVRQTGPGQYEAELPTGGSGSYLLNLRYDAEGESGSVQAAVVRPYSDEFRALSDNSPLLLRAAEFTGGRQLDGINPEKTPLFSREGLVMPVARRPAWLAVALAALGLFVVDVGVRRVRVDPAGVMRALRRALRPSAGRGPSQEIEALRGVRARLRTSTPTASEGDPSAAASRKFEAGADFKAGSGPIVESPGRASEHGPAAPPKAISEQGGEASGLSRLRQAKQRAREAQRPQDHPRDDTPNG